MEKARTQVYPLQMTDIQDKPFDKIAIDLVSDLNVSTLGNEHILTIINHLMGWQEAFPSPTRKQILLFMSSSISTCLFTCALTSCCQTMAQISRTSWWTTSSNYLALIASFLPHITHKVMVIWKFSTNTLNILLRNCVKRIKTTGTDINQVLASYCVTSHLATAETLFFLVYGRDPNLLLHQLLEPMQQFLSDSYSQCPDLKSQCHALAIARKTLDENRFKHKRQQTACHLIKYSLKTSKLANRT